MGVDILNLGQIDDIVTRTKGGVVAQKNQRLWTGGISPAARVASNKSLQPRIDRVLDPRVLNSYFVACDLSSRARCIDGRVIEGYDDDLAMHGRPLGPQIPGGTALAALTRRIVHAEPITEALSFTKDLESTINVLQQNNLSFGGHVDNVDHPHGDTGCGAVDKIPEILATVANPRSQRQVRGLAEKLLGVRYDDKAVDTILGRIINLQSVAERYFEVNRAGTYMYKQKFVQELRRKGDHVSRLVGPHYEVGLVVNLARGTTFDRDRFSTDNENELQLFNFDFWFSMFAAGELYPVTQTVSYDVAKKNLRLQHEYILCRTLLAIAVAMVLTDGSIKLLVRK